MTVTPLYPIPAKLYLCKSLLASPLESSTIRSKLNESSYPTVLATPNTSCFCISNLEKWRNYFPVAQERELEVIFDSLFSAQWHFSLSQSSDPVDVPYSHLSILMSLPWFRLLSHFT